MKDYLEVIRKEHSGGWTSGLPHGGSFYTRLRGLTVWVCGAHLSKITKGGAAFLLVAQENNARDDLPGGLAIFEAQR